MIFSYIPNTGWVWMFMPESSSLGSSPSPAALWSLKPRPFISRTVALATSTIAKALFSWSVTNAVASSADNAMNSGSRSWATDAPGPNIRTLGSRTAPLNAVKSAVLTDELDRSPRFSWRRDAVFVGKAV